MMNALQHQRRLCTHECWPQLELELVTAACSASERAAAAAQDRWVTRRPASRPRSHSGLVLPQRAWLPSTRGHLQARFLLACSTPHTDAVRWSRREFSRRSTAPTTALPMHSCCLVPNGGTHCGELVESFLGAAQAHCHTWHCTPTQRSDSTISCHRPHQPLTVFTRVRPTAASSRFN